MLKGAVLVLGVALMGVGLVSDAVASSKWERELVQRYASREKCDGHGAPAWGRASMQRWQASQRSHQRY